MRNKLYFGFLWAIFLAPLWSASFEENRGQFSPPVRFAARGEHSTLLVENRALHVLSHKSGLRIEFAGAMRPVAQGLRPNPALTTHLLPRFSSSGNPVSARTFDQVRIPGLYPGIDLLVYPNGTDIEFDFELAPHADPTAIRMKVAGSGAWAIALDGVLTLGEIRLLAPVAYQTVAGHRTLVPARFQRQQDAVSLRLAHYDKSLPLTIDPIVRFTRYLGGDGNEDLPAVAADAQGNSYIGGRTESLPDSLTPSATLAAGLPELFVAKYDPNGNLVYKTVIGSGSRTDEGVSVIKRLAVDAAGQLVIAGSVYGTIAVKAATQDRPRGNHDGFLMKLNAQGSDLIFGTYWGTQLFGTGFGSYGPPDPDGLFRLLQPLRVVVAGVPAQVLFAGQAPGATNGLQQINILLDPATPTGNAQPVEISVGDVSVPPGVTLTIR